ncbi:MAG: TlpA family protein disulfide reductase [Chloroflexi bacterium]|nr:TlpA family protein disulfide reductase [Chloroflexota bacterium]
MSDLDFLQEPQPNPPTARRGLSFGSIVLLIGILAVMVVFAFALARQRETQPMGGPAPDFELMLFDGSEFRLSEQRGRVVVLNFWASWCGPCREEAPELERIWQRYQDEGVVVVGVTYVDNERDSLAFMEEYGMTYPNGPDHGTVITRERYFIRGVPETFIIDQNGEVVFFKLSAVSEQELIDAIEPLLDVS